MNTFKLKSPFKPTGDQPQAIQELEAKLKAGSKHQVLLGVTGSGKTFTIANLIEKTQKPTLVIAHNKTLAAQLYQEFRDFFPQNAVSYFVSYYDYYQPEAYLPKTDTYIEKEADINDEIDKLRLAATTHLLTRPDVIVVASVSCIYNLGSPAEYGQYVLEMIEGEIINRNSLLTHLTSLQYERTTHDLLRGKYRLRGDIIQIWPAYQDVAFALDTLENKITSIKEIDPTSGMEIKNSKTFNHPGPRRMTLFPAKHYMVNPQTQLAALKNIEAERDHRVKELIANNQQIEAYRLKQKVSYDVEMIREFGFTSGIENYSRHFDGRKPGEPPFTLLEYFKENARRFNNDSFLTVIDESHMTLPQIRGMYFGDKSRKETLINYGFRLPSAIDNRPLRFEEFQDKTQQLVYVSATPADWEISHANHELTEQLIRPTGLTDPIIELRPISGQVRDLTIEVILRKLKGQRTLVTTLTKKMSEALTDYLNDTAKIDQLVESYFEEADLKEEEPEQTLWAEEMLPIDKIEIGKIDHKYFHHLRHGQKSGLKNLRQAIKDKKFEYPKVAYLHSEIETLERSDILDELREGKYDVLVGINLLREGLDLPEVTLVAILDADKEGFLRSETALVQTMGRAARHIAGSAILYADNMTKSIKGAVSETQRRRQIQIDHNIKQGITPESISKPIRKRLLKKIEDDPISNRSKKSGLTSKPVILQLSKKEAIDLTQIDPQEMTPDDKIKLSKKLRTQMNRAAKDMDFELAALIRDSIKKLEQ